jgi:hypothetical protein
LALIIGIIVGIATGILVGEYSLWRAEELKRIEKTVLKERMMRENEILEKRYKEDYELWLKQDSLRYIEAIDSINGHFSARGMGRSGARLKALQDYETKRNVRLKEKELEYKREVEDLKLKLDF